MTEPNFRSNTVWTGDNLHVMRGMNSDCIDLIYLDPPYNSNRNFSAPIGSKAAGAHFRDTWTLGDIDLHEHGELAELNEAVHQVISATKSTHGNSMMSYLIYMSVRLLEMQRILKNTGSIYLHVDPTASHYLKLVMDGIFGKNNLISEITWKRQTAHSDAKAFGNIKDTILVYKMPKFPGINVDDIKVPLTEDEISARYNLEDSRGKYSSGDLTAKGLQGGGYDYTFYGHNGPWRFPEMRMKELVKEDRIHYPKREGGVPRLKKYLHEHQGVSVSNLWTDIPPPQREERLGYPTQKPLALLRRIIKASSKTGELVFDPFCGCATALVEAERLKRKWIGCDISKKAVELVTMRIKEDDPLFNKIYALTEFPKRNDVLRLPNYRTHKHALFGKQKGICNGCNMDFPYKIFEIDHIAPKSQGGGDNIENLQLLCSHCNRVKGDRTMAEFRAEMQRLKTHKSKGRK